MKRFNSIIAIFALAIVAIAVAFVSCKKDNENALSQKDYSLQQAADIRQMDDPRSYFIDFKKKLTESKSNEAYNLDDAAWHLACLANLDFCKVNVEYNDVQFDTIEMQVNVTDSVVLLSDLDAAYQQMCTEIQQFKKGFNHENQNLYYINVSISTDGIAKIALMISLTNSSISRGLDNHTWYFNDSYDAYVNCYEYFTPYSTYLWYTTAKSELQRVLNLFDHQENYQIEPGGIIVLSYIPTRNHTFDYTNSTDSYGSNYFGNARLFTIESDLVTPMYMLSTDEMCYCLDSYLGLGYDYIDDHLYYNERPVCWIVDTLIVPPYDNKWYKYGHQLYVEYGRPLNGFEPSDD